MVSPWERNPTCAKVLGETSALLNIFRHPEIVYTAQ